MIAPRKRRALLLSFLSGLSGISLLPFAHADDTHYRNMLFGERAAGLAGAFTAISDDPTGIVYNPAGLVFAFENYISASANTFTANSITYKGIVPGQNYELKSLALVPTFFGFTQSYGKDKIGFAVAVPNYDLFDQDDVLTNVSLKTDYPNIFKRRYFRQDTTYLAGPAYSHLLRDNLSVGVSLLGYARLDNAIDNQLIEFNPVGTGKYVIQNTYLKQTILGLTPKLGIQYMPQPKLSLGLTIERLMVVRAFGKRKSLESTCEEVDDPNQPGTKICLPNQNGSFDHDFQADETSFDPYVAQPWTFSLGAAYFQSKSFLLTSDFYYYTADSFSPATFNVAAGAEWYTNPSLVLRFGAFTNRAHTPNVVVGQMNQRDHVNLLGGSFSISLLKSGSSFTLGGNYSYGTGQGQIIADPNLIQDVKQSAISGYIAGSYQL